MVELHLVDRLQLHMWTQKLFLVEISYFDIDKAEPVSSSIFLLKNEIYHVFPMCHIDEAFTKTKFISIKHPFTHSISAILVNRLILVDEQIPFCGDNSCWTTFKDLINSLHWCSHVCNPLKVNFTWLGVNYYTAFVRNNF